MSEIVRGRSRGGYLTVENYIEDGLLEIGSIDLAGFYGALKRFVDRRECVEGNTAMPWTVELFCSKFKIGKQRFYRLSEMLWQVGLLDVAKDFGVLSSEKGIMGWRNRYVVHDFPDYDGPLRLAREGSYKYKRSNTDNTTSEDESELKINREQVVEGANEGCCSKEETCEIENKSKEGVFLYRNTPEYMFGGIPTAGIPAVERHIKDKGSKTQDTIKTNIHPSIHHNKDNDRARAKTKDKLSVDNVDSVDLKEESLDTTIIKSLLKAAGFEGSEMETDYIAQWTDSFHVDMIEHALKKSVLNGKKNLFYVGGIFESWLEKGVKTMEEAEKESRYDLRAKVNQGKQSEEGVLDLPGHNVFDNYLKRHGGG